MSVFERQKRFVKRFYRLHRKHLRLRQILKLVLVSYVPETSDIINIIFFSLSPSNLFYVYVIFYLYIADNNENMSNLFILNANPKVGISWICWWSTHYSKCNNLIIRMVLSGQRLLKWLLLAALTFKIHFIIASLLETFPELTFPNIFSVMLLNVINVRLILNFTNSQRSRLNNVVVLFL